MLDLMIWPLDGADAVTAQSTRFIAAVGGAVMTGWGVMIWMLTPMMRTEPQAIRRVIGVAIGTWFVIDCAGSFAAGVPLNLLGNMVFLAIFGAALRLPGPLAKTTD